MKRWFVAVLAFVLPALSLAAETDQRASAAASNIGRALGVMLFGYLVMKFMNRNKEDDGGRPRGTSKILIGVLVLVILLAIFGR